MTNVRFIEKQTMTKLDLGNFMTIDEARKNDILSRSAETVLREELIITSFQKGSRTGLKYSVDTMRFVNFLVEKGVSPEEIAVRLSGKGVVLGQDYVLAQGEATADLPYVKTMRFDNLEPRTYIDANFLSDHFCVSIRTIINLLKTYHVDFRDEVIGKKKYVIRYDLKQLAAVIALRYGASDTGLKKYDPPIQYPAHMLFKNDIESYARLKFSVYTDPVRDRAFRFTQVERAKLVDIENAKSEPITSLVQIGVISQQPSLIQTTFGLDAQVVPVTLPMDATEVSVAIDDAPHVELNDGVKELLSVIEEMYETRLDVDQTFDDFVNSVVKSVIESKSNKKELLGGHIQRYYKAVKDDDEELQAFHLEAINTINGRKDNTGD